MPKTRSNITSKERAQSYATIAGFIAFFIGYLFGESILVLQPHPYHWASGFGLATVIGLAVYVVALWRERRNAQHR